MSDIRPIPKHIQRTFLALRSNESYRTALEWLMNEYSIGKDIEIPDEANDYRKGLNDAILFQAQLTGLRFTQSLETDKNDENEEQEGNE